jgi:hypothetical protein
MKPRKHSSAELWAQYHANHPREVHMKPKVNDNAVGAVLCLVIALAALYGLGVVGCQVPAKPAPQPIPVEVHPEYRLPEYQPTKPPARAKYAYCY